ncbi:MAG: glycosyltransferase [Methanobacteriaceae archaeon]|jgi:GT2 family glycosyltransferase|nr:glycosyltransferase [Candidatus Methanorudis spinitermitis]
MNLKNYISLNIKKILIRSVFLYIVAVNKFNIKKIFIDIKGYYIIKKKGLFDLEFYLENITNIGEFKFNPILHYLYYGGYEKKDPNPNFSSDFYLKKYEDTRVSKLNPLIHYAVYGLNEGKVSNFAKYTQEKTQSIINQNRERVNIVDFDENSPLVSIIILNRNGLSHLKRLFKNFKENIQYPNYEVIIIDNASSDGSIKFLREIEDIPIKIIENEVNESFSHANNKGVEISNGEFVLLLNNDIETTYGWLNEMMQTSLKNNHNGTVGAKLVFPYIFTKNKRKKPFRIQHIGIGFFESSNGRVIPYNIGSELKPFHEKSNIEIERGGVTAATLLVKKSIFKEVGGLDEDYNYGYEDVDFCLKILKKGYKNIYCPNALLFHHEHGTDISVNTFRERLYRAKSNKSILYYKWNKFLIENIMNEKLNKKSLLSEKPLNISFISNSKKSNKTKRFLSSLVQEINKYGWESEIINMDEKNVYKLNRDIDILISTVNNYYPQEMARVKGSLIKFGLVLDFPEEWSKNPAIGEYDLLITPEQEIHDYLMYNSIESTIISREQNEFIQLIKSSVPNLIEKYLKL